MIDKARIYIHNNYQYKNFVLLTEEEKEIVWLWRNHYEVRKWMYNPEIISLENHLNFINFLERQTDRYYWVAYKNNQPYGVVNIIDVDDKKRTGEVGLYRNPLIEDNGGGLDFYYTYYDFLFFSIGLETLIAGISSYNNIAMLLNSFLGFNPVGIKTDDDDRIFYKAVCIRKNIEKEWRDKNNLRAMLKYFKSPSFVGWKNSIPNPMYNPKPVTPN
jgi:UDP-4-amino-4,6-dideoxy-N-acetyl-beta-L-altrosamine N-acetyltransferase